MSKGTETCPLNPKFPKFTFPRNSLILPRMVHIRIKVDLLPVRVSRDSQVTTDHPRLFPGWCTVQHSHTPVQVSRDSQVITDHPRLFPGWCTVQHSHTPVQVSRDSQVITDHPRLFPGWCTVHHSHTPVQVSRDTLDGGVANTSFPVNEYCYVSKGSTKCISSL